MVRGRGYIRSIKDIETVTVGGDRGTPILVRDIASVSLGPDMRRGIAELDGKGEVVGGIVVMRHGENALNLIDRVKQKIKEIEPALPSGVKIVSTYDRSDLILRSIATLKEKLIEESLIVSLVIVIFLFHVRSALVVIITLPIAIILSFIAIYYLNLTSNIMSLGGIAIAIGAMVDAAIVMVENAHKRLEQWEEAGRPGDRTRVLIDSAQEVGKPLFFSLLIITVSFLPIFTLEAQEGRLFQPLAFTKTFAMFFAAFLSITLAPVLMVLLIRGRIRPETRCAARSRRPDPAADRLVCARRARRAAVSKNHHSAGCDRVDTYLSGLCEARLGIYAAAQRGNDFLYAHYPARNFRNSVSKTPADSGPHAQNVSRGPMGFW